MATAPVGNSFGVWLTARGYQVEHVENAKRACRVHLKRTGREARSELNKLWLKWSGNETEELPRLPLYENERALLFNILMSEYYNSSYAPYRRDIKRMMDRIKNG